ncbi:hypothetical protein BJ166DRAFT_532751 [Pestalotiopsis sp. NC0098]|nr:hypothetical protein BJ166DRAFT_532751 [Pestalotiopsis sp. NC0098]
MSSGDQSQRGGLDDTIEWKLIHGLCQHGHRFALNLPKSRHSSKSKKLLNTIQSLNGQIRMTFTILKLDLLLCLDFEDEDEDEDVHTSSESDSDASLTNSDCEDDTSPASSAGTHPFPRRDVFLKPFNHPSLSPPVEALRHLEKLCRLLEARVNATLFPMKPADDEQAQIYPRLTKLLGHLDREAPYSSDLFELIPCSDSAVYLFDIAKDSTTAKAFIDFFERKPLDSETRRQMLLSATDLLDHFHSFNEFVNKLQFSAASLGNATSTSNERRTNDLSSRILARLKKFRQQTTIAYRAFMSHISFCTRSDHRVLLELPEWHQIAQNDRRNAPENLHVHLFFTLCKREEWQLARTSLFRREHIQSCRQHKLYQALHSSYNKETDLEFYVSEDFIHTEHKEISVQVPVAPNRMRKYGTSSPNQEASLRTLIERNYFAREHDLDMWYGTGSAGTVVRIDERKALAIKLVLGLMLSMDSNFGAWNPRDIYFLDPVDADHTPFVSVCGDSDQTTQEGFSLPELSVPSSVDEDEDDLKPFHQFMSLAKDLLRITLGVHLRSPEKKSSKSPQEAWKTFRRTIESYMKSLMCKPEVDRKAVPFLQAALGCLDFHIEYESRMRQAKSKGKTDIAWEVVFDTILVNIDSDLAREVLRGESPSQTASPVTHRAFGTSPSAAVRSHSHTFMERRNETREWSTGQTRLANKDSSQLGIRLFDTKQAVESTTAHEFWTLLEKFHRSYSQHVSDRSGNPGMESPRRIRIAVLDTGIDFRHPAIREAKAKGRVREEWCYSWVDHDPGASDDDNELHGTNCVELLHKAAPEADIYVAKVFSQNSVRLNEAENIAKAIRHAADVWNVDIISMSFGLRRPEANVERDRNKEHAASNHYRNIIDDIERSIRRASHNPRIIFAAASNDGKNAERAFPANYQPRVICVHASHGNGEDGGINPPAKSGFMTLGMGVELSEREWITKGGRDFPKYKKVIKSGTSFATPIAAGIAATVLDLASRVEAIDNQVKDKLSWSEGLEKVLNLMTVPDAQGGLSYMAPWHHWKSGWETDETEARSVWDTINRQFYR